MKFTHSILRERLLARAGLLLPQLPPFAGVTFAQLRQSEWSEAFENLMRNRLVMGALRYAPMVEKRKGTRRWDMVGAMRAKLEKYEETGNTEYLVDMANYCLLEFECGQHPKRHFHALDDHSDHCRELK